jgi:hypothetical protein
MVILYVTTYFDHVWMEMDGYIYTCCGRMLCSIYLSNKEQFDFWCLSPYTHGTAVSTKNNQQIIPMYLISYALFGCIATRLGEFEGGINKAIYNQHQEIT